MNPKARTILVNMGEADWKKLILKLGRYAAMEARRLSWRTGKAGELPGGENVGSIVSAAIEKVFSGERQWDPDKHPDLGNYLRDVIDSLLWHLATGKDNRFYADMPEEHALSAKMSATDDVAWLTERPPTPEQLLLRREEEDRIQRIWQLLLHECRADDVAERILFSVREGTDKPADIANKLGVQVTDVYSGYKRLSRRLQRIANKMSEQGEHMPWR